jgi:TPR repeat protein
MKQIPIRSVLTAGLIFSLTALTIRDNSAFAGLPEAEAALAQKDYQTAYRELLPLANASDAQAQRMIGALYLFGQGRPKDPSVANQWFEKAANGGDRRAQYLLGRSYKLGNGVARNDRTAFSWFLKAAEAGHLNAQAEVAFAYHFGMGVQKNLGAAINWYRKAADRGHLTSVLVLAEMYRFGNARLGKDIKRTIALYQRAASKNERGSARALQMLANIHERGEAGNADPVSAFAYYDLALKQFRKERAWLETRRKKFGTNSRATARFDKSIEKNATQVNRVEAAIKTLTPTMTPPQRVEARKRAREWSTLIKN